MTAQIVSFNCVLKNRLGQVISSSVNRDVLTSMQNDEAMLRGLAQGMQNLKPGDKRQIFLKAEEAYGLYDPSKVILLPRKRLADHQNVSIGQTVSVLSKSNRVRTYRVIQVYGDMVTLDGNHPLAGQDLVFEIEATHVRQATEQEVAEAQNVIAIQHLH